MPSQQVSQLPQLAASASAQHGNPLRGASEFFSDQGRSRPALANVSHRINASDSSQLANLGLANKANVNKSGLSFRGSLEAAKHTMANLGPPSNHGALSTNLVPTTSHVTPLGKFSISRHDIAADSCVAASMSALPRNRPVAALPPLKQVSQSTSDLPSHIGGARMTTTRKRNHEGELTAGPLAARGLLSLGEAAATASPAAMDGRARRFKVTTKCLPDIWCI